jgi:hypothetical protein
VWDRAAPHQRAEIGFSNLGLYHLNDIDLESRCDPLSVKDFSEVGDRVTAACSFVNSGAGTVMPHLRWELQQVMSRVRPEDLSAAEVAALLAILMPAHARVIGGPPGRPRLRVLGSRREHAASQPA